MTPTNRKTSSAFELDASIDDLGVSPMTGLSINLGNTLQIRRNLTFNSNENTPVKPSQRIESGLKAAQFSPANSPTICLLKDAFKSPLSKSPRCKSPRASCYSPTSVQRKLPLMSRRLHNAEKENSDSSHSHAMVADYNMVFQSPNSKTSRNVFRSVTRHPMEDLDSNSQDSCYSSSSSRYSDDSVSASEFRFKSPNRLPPKRSFKMDSLSPFAKSSNSSPPSNCKQRPQLFHSSSTGSEYSDDGFMEHFPVGSSDFIDQDENAQFPDGFGSLLRGPIVNRLEHIQEVSFLEGAVASDHQRTVTPATSQSTTTSLSATALESSPVLGLFANSEDRKLGKRAADPQNTPSSSSFLKRRKSDKKSPSATNILRSELNSLSNKQAKFAAHRSVSIQEQSMKGTMFNYGFTKVTVKKFHRSYSETEATIEKALERATSNPNLIGNFSKPLALPIHHGKHSDLKNISCSTLAKLIRGEYSHVINSYKIIDCRYPYEYAGGHIKYAVNLYTEEQIMGEFMKPGSNDPPVDTTPDSKRDILIFHCEFSSKRGPNLLRYLRNMDRNRNKYPSLNYPEMYLLDGGYRAFYDECKEFCEPQAYLPMNSYEHRSMFNMFKQRSKSCSNFGDSQVRNMPKRLGL